MLKTTLTSIALLLLLMPQARAAGPVPPQCIDTDFSVSGSFASWDNGSGYSAVVLSGGREYSINFSQNALPFTGCSQGTFLLHSYSETNDYGVTCIYSIVSGTCDRF